MLESLDYQSSANPHPHIIHNDTIISDSNLLAHKIVESGWDIDIVLTILNGGEIIGQILGDRLGKPVLEVSIGRDFHHLKKLYEKYPDGISHQVIRILQGINFLFTKPKLRNKDEVDTARLRGMKVLIVDDVLHTGKTMSAAEELVNTNGGVVSGKAYLYAIKGVKFSPNTLMIKENTGRIILPWSYNYDQTFK